VSSHTQLQIGAEFLDYRIEERIGQGGMGVVYRAYDLRLKRTVALKVVAPDLELDERFRARFARESELAMSLEHPNVVPIHDAGEVDGRLYLTMRLVVGTDLRALLRAEGALVPSRALAIASQIANALDAAHARGLVHRDVKPSNVLLDGDEHVYLADFGLTRRLEEQGANAGEGRSLGTPAYLAPEQIEGERVGGPADVYSLGCLLYECLTGRPPFSGDSRLAVGWAHLEERPPSASAHEPNLPLAIDSVIQRSMAKAPDERYPTCTALIAAAGDALGLRHVPVARRRRLLRAGIAGSALAVIAAALATVLIVRAGTEAEAQVVRENTIVRIDPATNTIRDVVDVGFGPWASAIGGRSVWVYSRYDSAVTEIDAATGALRHTTHVAAAPVDLGLLSGPVLAADAAGAWIVGVDKSGRSRLTGLLAGARGKREYALDYEPRAVAVGVGGVWVLGRRGRASRLVRIDPETGKVSAQADFPVAAPVDSLTTGFGAVWAMSSGSAVLYRIDARSGGVTRQADLGLRAGRPIVRFGAVWAGVSDSGGSTVLVDPRTLAISERLDCCPLAKGYDTASGYGSVWTYDRPTGELVRFDAKSKEIVATIRVADAPFWSDVCMTSLAVGSGGVWVTVAPSVDGACNTT